MDIEANRDSWGEEGVPSSLSPSLTVVLRAGAREVVPELCPPSVQLLGFPVSDSRSGHWAHSAEL